MIPDYQRRVHAERSEVHDRLTKLQAFLRDADLVSLGVNAVECERLRRQLLIMQLYAQVLAERIAAFPDPEGRDAD